MLCLVKLPNSVVLEIELDFKSKGQECLDKVCEMLGIIEVDYFGLQYYGHHGELLWLNLRNPIKHQLTGACPYRLLFKVKFFVPPHLILQESTRQQFFLNLVIDLQEGRIRVNDKDLALKLTALIAQSELGDFVGTRPNSPTDASSPLSNSLSSLFLHYRKWLPFSLLESKDASSSTNAHLANDHSSSNCFTNRNTAASTTTTAATTTTTTTSSSTTVNSHFSPLTSRKNSSPAVVASGSDHDHHQHHHHQQHHRHTTTESRGQCNRSRRKHNSGHSDHGGDGALSSSEEGETEYFSYSAPSSPYESLLLMSTSPPTSWSNLGAGRGCFNLDATSGPQTATAVNCSTDSELSILCDSVARIHRTFKGMKQPHAKYLFLKEVSNLDDFGLEYFQVKANINDHNFDHCFYKLGIGPKGVTIEAVTTNGQATHSNSNPVIALAVASVDIESSQSSAILADQPSRTHLNSAITQLPSPPGVNLPVPHNSFSSKTSISYSCIQMATHSGRCLFLTYISDSSETNSIGFKCESGVAANAIYRAVTEKHAFYSCETVRNAVTSQFIRDLKGTIVSLFNEKTPLGKNYVFDIRRTCREVYDHTRRVLHQLDQGDQRTNTCKQLQQHQLVQNGIWDADLTAGQQQQTINKYPCESCDDSTLEDHGSIDLVLATDAAKAAISVDEVKCIKSSCLDAKKKLAGLQDSLLCRICMDADVCTAFFPCRHVVCCNNCSRLCDSCPICRSPVQASQKIYLPVSSCGKSVPLHHHNQHHHHHHLTDDTTATMTAMTTTTTSSTSNTSNTTGPCVQHSTSEPNENAQNALD